MPCVCHLPWVVTPRHWMKNVLPLDLQALPAQGCWPEPYDGQGSALGIAKPHLVADSSAT